MKQNSKRQKTLSWMASLFSPQKRLIKIENALLIGSVWLIVTSLGLVRPSSTPLTFDIFGGFLISKNIFFSWWYLALEILLTVSLLSCSFLDQLFVLKCITNTTNKLSATTVSVGFDLNLCRARLSSVKRRANQITGRDQRFIQQKVFRHWAPLGVHGVVSALIVYGALTVLYCFKTLPSVSVGEGLFLSGTATDETSSVYNRPLSYARINDMWAVEQPPQPFIDVSLLDMAGKEYARVTLTTSSRSATGSGLPADLSLQSLSPRRVRLDSGDRSWQVPALPITNTDTMSPNWLAYGPDNELVMGRENVFLQRLAEPEPKYSWTQQDFQEHIPNRPTPVLIEILREGSLSWATNDLSTEILFIPLLVVLLLLLGSPQDALIFPEEGPEHAAR